MLNEVEWGFNSHYRTGNYTSRPDHPQAAAGIVAGHPRITFRGFQIGGNVRTPQNNSANVYQLRDDVTLSFNKGGRHDMKLGGEYLLSRSTPGSGVSTAWVPSMRRDGPIPANLEACSRCQRRVDVEPRALAPIVRRYRVWHREFRVACPTVQPGGAGRLADHLAADAEPRPAVRPRMNVYANEVILPPIITEPASERYQQPSSRGSALRTD